VLRILADVATGSSLGWEVCDMPRQHPLHRREQPLCFSWTAQISPYVSRGGSCKVQWDGVFRQKDVRSDAPPSWMSLQAQCYHAIRRLDSICTVPASAL